MTDTLLLLYLRCYFKILNHPNRIGLTRAVEFCAIMCRVIRTAWKSYISSRMCHFFSDILFFHIFCFFLSQPPLGTDPLPPTSPSHTPPPPTSIFAGRLGIVFYLGNSPFSGLIGGRGDDV